MSTENTVIRAGRDVEPPPEQSGFQLPPELTRRYEVRIIPGTDDAQRRIGLFLATDRENPSIEISGNGERIVARKEDPETVASLVKIAKHNGWEGIDVDGSPEFRKAVWAAGTREGLTVRGYEPDFGEQARMDELKREDAVRREREAAAKAPVAEQGPGRPEAEVATVAGTTRSADAERAFSGAEGRETGGMELSTADQRLLLTMSVYTQDRKGLEESVRPDMSPMEREFQHERLDLNREALNGALDRVLESETLVSSFSKSGYEPDDLRKMARAGEWDGEIADAVYLVRSGLHRDTLERDVPDQAAREPATAEPVRSDVEQQSPREAAGRRSESDELAELFLHGGSERISSDPRLANAREAQAMMERHLGAVFDGDVGQTSAATLESRQMISDVLRRGLDVSVREPTPIRQIEPAQPTPDLER